MLKRKALMDSISSNLHGFLKKIANNLSVPDKKFLRDGLVGLIRCDKPIVCQMARHVPNQRTNFLSYRLLGGLTEAINTCFWLHKDLLRKSLG